MFGLAVLGFVSLGFAMFRMVWLGFGRLCLDCALLLVALLALAFLLGFVVLSFVAPCCDLLLFCFVFPVFAWLNFP